MKYVAECVTYVQVNVDHQQPYGEMKHLEIPEWKRDKITMDFCHKVTKNFVGK